VTVYGITGEGLWHQFLIMGVGKYTKQDCEGMLEKWFTKYSGVFFFMQEIKDFAFKHGYVDDYFGYRCYVPEVNSCHDDVVERGLRQACNFVIQCPSAAQTKMAMKRWGDVVNAIPGWKPLLQIHDEVISEVPEDKIEDADNILRYVMNDAVTGMKLPFTSEGKVGVTWADMVKL
jgi:DNA polymerase-1